MHIKDHSAAMKFFRTYDNVASKGKWKEFVDEMEFDSMLQEPRTMVHEPRNMYAGGQLVRNTVDGSRPGYQGKADAGFYQKIINNYKNSVAKDFASGDMSKTGSWRNYLQKKYPKNWKKLQNKIKNELNPPTRYQFSFKNKLMKNLIEEANQGERFVQMTEIIDKVTVPAERVDRPGQIRAKSLFEVGEWVDPKLPKLETQQQKVLKVFNSIINNNEVLQLKDPNFKFGRKRQAYGGNLLRKIIAERTGTASYKSIADALEKHPKMKLKKFRKIFDYMSRSHVNDFEGHRFKDAFDYATDRRSGAAYFTNVNKNIMYKNPDVNIMNYALRHWDGNNFNGIDSLEKGNRIQFFDKKTGDPIKWKSGLRLSPRNVYFTMDGNPMKWNTRTLKTHGKASGLFDEVVDITNSYYKTYNKPVPDGKGGTIKFGDLVGKNNMAIGHNAIGGVKEEPFKNFQLQSKKMNLGIYHATKHIKNKDLQKRVIGNIYGSLNNLKGDKYIDEFITNFPTTGYKEAGKQIIEGSPEWMKWSSRKQAELFKVAGVSAKDFNALDNAKPNEKISMLKKMGFKCRLVGGAGESVDCYMKDVGETNKLAKQGNKQAIKKLGNAFDIGKELPKVGKLFRQGLQIGLAGPANLLEWSGLGTWGGLLLEGAVEGGIYKYYKDYKGLTHEQSLAETFTPGLMAGRPEGVPWYGGSEALQERELYEVKDAEGNIRIKQNVKDFIDTQRKMDQIGTEYDKLESQKRDINEMRGYASQYGDTDYAHPRLDPRVGIESKQKALENEYLKLEQLNKPDALTGNYNAWLVAKEKQDTEQGLRVAKATKKRLGVVDIPWDDLSKPDYVLKGYERAQDRWEKEQSEKRYRQMREKFPGYSDKQIDEILAYYETSQPEVGMSYGELKKRFNIGDKQAYFADNFRTEKAEGGIMNLKKKW